MTESIKVPGSEHKHSEMKTGIDVLDHVGSAEECQSEHDPVPEGLVSVMAEMPVDSQSVTILSRIMVSLFSAMSQIVINGSQNHHCLALQSMTLDTIRDYGPKFADIGHEIDRISKDYAGTPILDCAVDIAVAQSGVLVADLKHSQQLSSFLASYPQWLRSIADTLGGLRKRQPAVPIDQSVTPDFLICLEDGKKLKLLKRHLKQAFNMTPAQYRARWGLPDDYPMVAENYSKVRSKLAQENGLGHKTNPDE